MKLVAYTMPRPFGGHSIPIAIQSCFMRDFCNRNSLLYPLPVTEFCIKGCFTSLDTIIAAGNSNQLLVTSLFIFSELNLSEWDRISDASADTLVIAALENKRLNLSETVDYINNISEIRKLQASFVI